MDDVGHHRRVSAEATDAVSAWWWPMRLGRPATHSTLPPIEEESDEDAPQREDTEAPGDMKDLGRKGRRRTCPGCGAWAPA